MGNAGLAPRVMLQSELQLHFKKVRVAEDVESILKEWFEDGAPLGLTSEMFDALLLVPKGRSASLFGIFDTDGNGKVDALEVLAAVIFLAAGSVDEKVEVVFKVFDFSGSGRLNFDEASILLHSVCRGLAKVCGTGGVEDEALAAVCHQLFDAHNLPYDRLVSREQVRRWLRSDVEAARFVDVFHQSYALPEVEAVLAQREQAQAAAFSQLCGTESSAVPVQGLLLSAAFRRSLDDPPEDALKVLVSAMAGPRRAEVGLARFAEAARAWNVFNAVDSTAEGSLEGKEVTNLLWLQQREEPSKVAVDDQLKALNILGEGLITRTAWIDAKLESVGP